MIRLVDGFKIRNTLDDDFGIFHRFSKKLSWFAPKFYIPEGESWLDYRYEAEQDFLTAVEDFVPPPDLSYAEERKLILEKLGAPGDLPDFKVAAQEIDGLKVFAVDGAVVRRYLDPGFILGGHDLVYDYVPKGEIWLDKHMDPAERKYILHHEVVEQKLMSEGKSYDVAHDFATASDKELRRQDGTSYPGDDDPPFAWRHLSDEEIIAKYYVTK